MNALIDRRSTIDEIDRELIELLGRRMQAVREIGAWKGENREVPLHDPRREHEVFQFWTREGAKYGLSSFFLGRVLRELLAYSRRDQERHLKPGSGPRPTGLRVGYLGAPASYAEVAVDKLLPSRTDSPVEKSGFETHGSALDALEAGELDLLLLPIENTLQGSIHEVYRELARRELYLVDEEVSQVEHCLAGLPGAKVEDIGTVRSSATALQECQRFLRTFVGTTSETVYDPAAAAASVAEGGDPTVAAICSPEAAGRMGLHVLEHDVSDHPENRTRWVLLSRTAEHVDPRLPAKTSLLLTVNHRHGSLSHCLQAFSSEDLSLTKLESRPLTERPWEYLFYVDVEGNVDDERMKRALEAVREYTGSLRVLGCYPCRTGAEPVPSLESRAAWDEMEAQETPGGSPAADSSAAPAAAVAEGAAEGIACEVDQTAPPPRVSTSDRTLASLPETGRRTIVRVGNAEFGGDRFTLIAGPCAVESREQIMEGAEVVAELGAQVLRGGAFKPRSSPYSFQGLGVEGLHHLAEAGRSVGLPVVTEILRVEDIEAVSASADMLQVGARNMQNFELLKALGRLRQPILLKRGMSATIKELLQATEYILAGGNQQVVLCERGIRTFETATRSTLDVSSVPVLKERTHLPVIVDPSHAAGRRELVGPLALAGAAVGADGLIVEVHPHPEEALCDKEQALSPEDFRVLVSQLQPIVKAQGRTM
jgi:chorismate mutase / prephenate dehydratase